MTVSHLLNPSAIPTIGGASSQCPQNGSQVTGVRLYDTQPLAGASSRTFLLQLLLNGNAANDVYSNNAFGTSSGVALSALSPVATTSVQGFGELEAEKTVEDWDPNNTGVYNIPGSEVVYKITIRNIGTGPIDSGTIFLVDTLPTEVEFWNGDIDAGGPDNFLTFSSIGFEQSVGSGVIFNPATDLGFSTAATKPTDFSHCTFEPVDGIFRADILHICFKPQGVLSSGSPEPTISFSFRSRIK